MTITVSACYTYPLKSGKAVLTDELTLTKYGPENDRVWMLVHDTESKSGTFITQRDKGFEGLSLIETNVCDNGVTTFNTPSRNDLIVAKNDVTKNYLDVEIFKKSCSALDAGNQAAQWFSDIFNHPCRLVRMPQNFNRPVSEKYARDGELVSFADGFPLLVTSQPSLEALQEHIPKGSDINMTRFRANIVLDGNEPFEEDIIHTVEIGSSILEFVKPCTRCKMTTIDQQAGTIPSNEPLKTLSQVRRGKGDGLQGVFFGQNAIATSLGTIKTGDTVRVLSRKPLHTALQNTTLKHDISICS